MIRTILAAILIFAAFILFVLVIVFIKIFISPSFNSLGEINECVGCNGCTYKDGENYITQITGMGTNTKAPVTEN